MLPHLQSRLTVRTWPGNCARRSPFSWLLSHGFRRSYIVNSVVPLNEKALIARIRRQAGRSKNVTAGIGDDCAILRIPAAQEALVTTDFSMEGIHFRRDWHSAQSVGHRCLMRGLSDIAAMGGEPLAAFLSLAVPHDLLQRWVDDFLDGFLQLAKKHHVVLAGGDTAESPNGILADIIVLGHCAQGRAIRRSGARPGDLIYVTGMLGGSAFALRELSTSSRTVRAGDFPAHFFPAPRLAAGKFLREKQLATAMIDISDGLSTDLAHLCEESRAGAEIETSAIPLAKAGKSKQKVPLEFALHGGEDYELLFTAPAKRKIPARLGNVPITCIGRITREKKMFLIDKNGERKKLIPAGWEHFGSKT